MSSDESRALAASAPADLLLQIFQGQANIRIGIHFGVPAQSLTQTFIIITHNDKSISEKAESNCHIIVLRLRHKIPKQDRSHPWKKIRNLFLASDKPESYLLDHLNSADSIVEPQTGNRSLPPISS